MTDLGDIEYRSASTVDVRHAERVIDLIVAPYNEPAEVFLARQRRWVTESFVPGAFNGVGGEEVKVNRAHDVERPIGRAFKFHPNDDRGLRAEIRVSKAKECDDILEYAEERLLAASVGFGVLPGGEQWSLDRRTRQVTKARVVHIALTGDPAYNGAQVLAVRSAPLAGESEAPERPRVPTPNLDQVLLEMREMGQALR
jgi:HK97 family phage prohead protease